MTRETCRSRPTSGYFTSFSQDFAGVGGDVQYFRSVVDARGYYPITNKITLVGRAQGGSITGWGGQDVRLTDLFFKGGETIRGFERAGYGPRDACENPTTGKRVDNCTRDSLGGQLFWATTAEVRFPFPYVPDSLGMQGAIFVDAGSLWDPSEIAVDAIYPAPPKAGGQLHLRQRRDAPVDRIQHHLAIAARPPPGGYRPGLA